MGLVTGVCSSLACCFSQAACQLCCSSCPPCKTSTSSRIGYCLMLCVSAVCSYICTTNFGNSILLKIWKHCPVENSNCSQFIGFQAVYHAQFSQALFFIFMALLMLGVDTSFDIRAMFQRGLWIFKVLIAVGLVIGVAFIPYSVPFYSTLMIIGYVSSFIFILIQMILLIDLAYSWSESWMDKGEVHQSWLWAMLVFILLLTGLGLSGVICGFIYLAKSADSYCSFPKFVLSFHLILTCCLYLLSNYARFKNYQTSSGLLESSVVFMYTTYLVFSALAFNEGLGTNQNSSSGLRGQSAGGSEHGQEVYDDEEDGVAYSYSLFHMQMFLACFYIMMTITNCPSDPRNLFSGVAAMWVKLVTSFLCQCLYGWSVIAPIVLRDRDFSV